MTETELSIRDLTGTGRACMDAGQDLEAYRQEGRCGEAGRGLKLGLHQFLKQMI